MRNGKNLSIAWALILFFLCPSLVPAQGTVSTAQEQKEIGGLNPPKWRTNTDKRSVELRELVAPGMEKDGIPPLDRPRFVSIGEAQGWLTGKEPVIALEVDRVARAYPLQILIRHEVVNDQIAGLPVAITFCTICHSPLVYDRRLNNRTLTFGISGFLRNADMVLYDRESESWWQQLTGEAIVGDLTGEKLKKLPSQIVSFDQFAAAFPKGQVLSRETGYAFDYGHNPNVGYDNESRRPLYFSGKMDRRLRPMEKVIGVLISGKAKAYPYSVSRTRRVIHDQIGASEIVIFHAEGSTSALDAYEMKASRTIGSTGVFDSRLDSRRLNFRYENGDFIDEETGSHWNILGQAVSGSLKGKSLQRIGHGDFFAFAWLAFHPATEIFGN